MLAKADEETRDRWARSAPGANRRGPEDGWGPSPGGWRWRWCVVAAAKPKSAPPQATTRPPTVRKKRRSVVIGYGRGAGGGGATASLAGDAHHTPGGVLDLGDLLPSPSALSRQTSFDSQASSARADAAAESDVSPAEASADSLPAAEGLALTDASTTTAVEDDGSKPLSLSEDLPPDLGDAVDSHTKLVGDEPHVATVDGGDGSAVREDADEPAMEGSAATPLPPELESAPSSSYEPEAAAMAVDNANADDKTAEETSGVARPADEGRRLLHLSEVETSMEVAAEEAASPAPPEASTTNKELGGDPPGPPSLEDQMVAVQDGLQRELAALRAQAANAVEARKAAVQSKRQAAAEAAACVARLSDLEAELAQACEREDFEVADEVSGRMADAEAGVKAAVLAVRAAEADVDARSAALQRLLDVEVEVELVSVSRLTEIQQAAEVAAAGAEGAAQEAAARVLEELTTEEEQLLLARRKLALERRVVEEEVAELSAQIEGATATERAEREEVAAAAAALAAELEELLEVVRRKQEEIAVQEALVADADARIAAAAARFQKSRAALESEELLLVERAAEVDAGLARLADERQRVDVDLADAEAARVLLAAVAGQAGSEAARIQELASLRQEAAAVEARLRGRREELAAAEEQCFESAAALRQHATADRAALQTLMAARLRLQQDTAAAQQKVAAAKKRAPELEAEKRLAATSRNFKEAARLAAEAKVLASEQEAALKEVEDLMREQKQLEEEESQQAAAVEELERELADVDRRAAMARCERLRLVAAAAWAEMADAAEAEDFVEAESLQTEAATADREADGLQQLHNLHGEVYDRVIGSPLSTNSEGGGLTLSAAEAEAQQAVRAEESRED
eukprot:SM000005S17333  [mRNA]  locus=s5:1538052:1556080:- [translate_table: standard]